MAGTDRPILVTGASGFVGRRVVARLRETGRRVRALVRPTSTRRMEVAEDLEVAECDIQSRESVAAAARGCAGCIHLVGILRQRGEATFQTVHVEGTEHVVAACREAGVRRLVHMSALGVERGVDTPYFRTKEAAEARVRESGLDWTVLRPSVIHGPRGDFTIQMARMVARPGPVPLVGYGLQVLQPVWVQDVASVAAGALGREGTVGRAYDVGGPDVLTLRAFYRTVSRVLLGREKWLFPVPRFAVVGGAWLASRVLANPPVTPEELRMLEAARPCDTAPVARDFDMQLAPFEDTLRGYAEALRTAAGID